MPHIANRSRAVAAITPFILSLACLWLGACGGSSTTNTTAAVASTPTATTASTPPPSTATSPAATTSTTAESSPPTALDKRRRQIALRVVKCFQADGVTLPEPTPQGYINVNTGGPKFKEALLKCKPVLKEAANLSNKK